MAFVLEFDRVTKIMGKTPVLADVTFRMGTGMVLGLVGPNGAGKSTTLNLAAGLLLPDQGRVRICGRDLQTERVEALQNLGYVSDTPFLYDHLTAREFLHLVGRLRGLADAEPRVDRLLARFQLPHDDRLLREYSLGMKKKVGLCAALLPDPPLVIMDEPFNAVDYAGTVSLQGHIRELHQAGATILVATHLLNLVTESCTHVLFMAAGRIGQIEPIADVLAAHGRLENAFLRYCGQEGKE